MRASLPPSLRRRATLTGIAIVVALVPTFGQVTTPRPRLLVTQVPELTYDV